MCSDIKVEQAVKISALKGMMKNCLSPHTQTLCCYQFAVELLLTISAIEGQHFATRFSSLCLHSAYAFLGCSCHFSTANFFYKELFILKMYT